MASDLQSENFAVLLVYDRPNWRKVDVLRIARMLAPVLPSDYEVAISGRKPSGFGRHRAADSVF